MLPNIDQFLEQLRSDKLHIEERQLERQEAYKSSTQLFLKSIKNQIDTLDKTAGAHTLRNKEFKNQIANVYSRYMANSYRIIKTQRRSVDEKIYLNDFLVLAYPDYADKQKVSMEQKKEQLERRLETLKGLNRKENINYYEIMNQKYESFDYLDQIKARREQLQKEVMDTKKLVRRSSTHSNAAESNDQENRYLKDFKDKYFDSNHSEGQPHQSPAHHIQSPPYQQLPIPQPVYHNNNDSSLLDDFLLPMGKQALPDQQQWMYTRPLSSNNLCDSTDARNLIKYIPTSNQQQRNLGNTNGGVGGFSAGKHSMLEQFTMKGPAQNLNGSFRQNEEIASAKQRQIASASRSRNPQINESEFKRFEDSRENSPEYQHNNQHQFNSRQLSNNRASDLKNYLANDTNQEYLHQRQHQQHQQPHHSQRPGSARKRFE